MPKVLISDEMNDQARQIFEAQNVQVDVKTGLSEDELVSIISAYDGLAIRSSTKVTQRVIDAATNLKVIGRAGIGVDNIDILAATAAGVIVMNTPFGNSITTAEHAIAMMFSLARDIPQANQSTHAGKWEKNRFMGVELYGKILGVVGCGNIGAIVASRAIGLQMKVIAFDPFLTDERAHELGVEKVELEDIWTRSDFITFHVPKNEQTTHMVNRETIQKMKPFVRIINCARGGIIDEVALNDALNEGRIAGAALDVFEIEPARENIIFGNDKVICTPHLGASTDEAQVNVAIQVAEQMSAYLINGAVENALNMPSITAEEAPRLMPYMKLCEQLGSFLGQITDDAPRSIEITYAGAVAQLNHKPLTALITASFLRASLDNVNMVNAPQVVKQRGIHLSETLSDDAQNWLTLISVRIVTDHHTHEIAGTLFAGKAPRIVLIDGVPIEAALSSNMLLIANDDRPGLIGGVGTLLAQAEQNIADFRLGRLEAGGLAVALIALDAPIPNDVFNAIKALPQVVRTCHLSFTTEI
jgi:D-3-phosphoglycerate dehydrogenase